MKSLIIGLGSIAQKHVAALRKIDKNVEIAALRSSRKSKPFAGIEDLFTVEEAKDFAPDHTVICTPSSEHLETIKEALKLNCPLFIEKPALIKFEGSTALMEELRNLKTYTYVACNLRFLESLIFLKSYLKNKTVQEVTAYCGSYLPDWRPNQDFNKSYSASSRMGGGVHLDLIHELDYIYWLFGEPIKNHSFLNSKSELNIDSIDSAHYVLDFSNYSAFVTLNYFRRDPKRTLEITLNDETLLVNLIENTVYSFKEKSFIFESNQKIIDTYAPQLKSFFKGLANNRSPYSLEEHLKVLEICLNEHS